MRSDAFHCWPRGKRDVPRGGAGAAPMPPDSTAHNRRWIATHMNAPCSPCTDALSGAAPDSSRAAWLAVGSIAVGTFAMVTTEFLPIGLLTDIGAGLQVSDGTAG